MSFQKAGEVLETGQAVETKQTWHGLYRGSVERWPIGGESEGSWKPKSPEKKGSGRGIIYSEERLYLKNHKENSILTCFIQTNKLKSI